MNIFCSTDLINENTWSFTYFTIKFNGENKGKFPQKTTSKIEKQSEYCKR